MLQSEFQRESDISSYARYIDKRADPVGHGAGVSMMGRGREHESQVNARMAMFTLTALNGILGLLEA